MAATSAPDYLASQTASLEAQAPVEPSQARAAQIPLKDFNLPTFPPAAFSSGLTSLILTADLKLNEYGTLLTTPFSIPALPPSITSLTLELFSLGYPPGFLSSLGQALPNLKSLTLYSQLFAGTSEQSREDALRFVGEARGVREVHVLDCFFPPGFFKVFSEALSKELKFLEVSYTYRHSDPGFLGTLPSKEIASVVRKGLVALTVGIGAPDSGAGEGEREGTEVGVRVVDRKEGKEVVEKVVSEGKGLVMLDLTMFEIEVSDVKRVLKACGKLKVLNLAVTLESGWDEVLGVLEKELGGVEAMEIVGVPGVQLVEKSKEDKAEQVTQAALQKLSASAKSLKSVKTSILRTNIEQWALDGGSWKKST